MTKSKVAIAGLGLLLASTTASAGCIVIDGQGTILCRPEVEVVIEDEAANRVRIPAYGPLVAGQEKKENGDDADQK